MDSISAFDFNNEGDRIIANDKLKLDNDIDQACDLAILSVCSNTMCHDIEMSEQQMSQLRTCHESKTSSIRPFIDIIDMNRADEDLVNEITPNPAVLIGLKGEF